MQETSETLLEETSELLDALIPIVQRSIDALQQDPNPLLQHLIDMQSLIDQEIERQEGLLQQVAEMMEKIHDCLNPPKPIPEQAEPENHLLLEILWKGDRGGKYAWRVTMPNGEQINCRYQIETFFEVINKLGIERVKDLGIKCGDFLLIETDDVSGIWRKSYAGYYIVNVKPTTQKIAILQEICNGLGITFEIDDLRRESVLDF